MKLPMNGLLNRQEAQTAMTRRTATRTTAVNKRNALDAILVTVRANRGAETWMKRTIFKEVSNPNFLL